MTSIKKTRRATVRRLKSAVTMCFLSLLHLKTPHDGCPTQYSHTTRMSGSFDSRRTSRMSGSSSFDSQRASGAFGSFDSPSISRVYGGYESRRTSRFICESRGCELAYRTTTTSLYRMASPIPRLCTFPRIRLFFLTTSSTCRNPLSLHDNS